ncbi:hypothetical protein [Streptomyces tirandamycinicus]|uniref:Integral membrane protein n=1 Tax=Streptomyces tirandamycinicus TaxID=2174846 RepID=A0A2S1SSN6_9ACTN|nr:hypothetical protein [Streptomyces tirandamycinicus]AWI29419.1 hypothetical protein DDW44_11920 [Streptomyces tirandamycinicus]
MQGHGHGHGYPPRPAGRPAEGTLIALRVLFIAMAVMSCSLLAWVPMLRLAIVTRKPVDWFLFCATVAANVGMLVFAGLSAPGDEEISDPVGYTILGWITVVMVGTITYYVMAETRHYERLKSGGGPAGGYGLPPQPPVAGYGYPPAGPTGAAANPYARPAQQPPVPRQPPSQSGPLPQPQPPSQSGPQPSAAGPAPGPAAGHEPNRRIDQVRAELDELSDLLRREPRPDGGDR